MHYKGSIYNVIHQPPLKIHYGNINTVQYSMTSDNMIMDMFVRLTVVCANKCTVHAPVVTWGMESWKLF